MPPTNAAMELKVLISVLQQGNMLANMVNQVNTLSQALTKLQNQVNAGASGGGPLPPTGPVVKGLQEIPPAAKSAEDAIKGIEIGINKLVSAVKFLTGGFLALQSVRFLKGLADDAAKVEVATTVLRVVAANAGYTAEQIDEVDKSVQKLGITARASKEALTSFLQARLPLTYAKDLARASQDLAVISGMNSSDTFKRLIVNIQQLDALGLRWMGIVVDRAAAEDKFRAKQEDTTKALNKRQQQEALMQEVLEKAKLLEGAYATAMGDVAKQLTSLDRLTETYRVTLGESLLPAYSGIVRVVTTTLDKFILLTQAFSANRERAKEWADAAVGIATAVSEILLFLAKHIDLLVTLARLYLEWRAAILVVNAALAVVAGWARFLVIINNIRYAIVALRAGMIGVAVAIQAVGAASTAEAVKIIALAAAQTRLAAANAAVTASAPGAVAGITAAGTAAAGTTAAVSGLALAWGSLATVLAVPIVGYIIYKIIAKAEEEAKRPVVQRAAEALEKGQRLYPNVSAGSLIALERAQAMAGDRMAFLSTGIADLYEQWKKGIDTVGKSESELMAQFERDITAFRAKVPNVGDTGPLKELRTQLTEVRNNVTALTTEAEQLRQAQRKATAPEDKRALGAERVIVERELNIQREKQVELQKQLTKAAKELPQVSGAGQEAVFAQIDKYDQAQAQFDKIRDTGSRKAVSAAQTELDFQKALLEGMKEQLELRLKTDKLTDAERKADEEALASIKSHMTEIADRAERIRTSTETLFGSKFLFTPEGETMSGQFAKELGAFQTLLDDAKEILEEEGAVPEQIAEKITRGITALGQSAKQPVDFARLQKILGEVPELKLPETAALSRQALELARLGVRDEALTTRAPIVAETKAQAKLISDARIAEAERYQARLKTLNASEAEQEEARYREGLVGLNEYYDNRMRRIQEEGDAQARVQGENIAALETQRALTDARDQKTRDDLQIQINRARSQLTSIQGDIEVNLTREKNARDARLRQLQREAQSGALGIIAGQAGAEGTGPALKQLEFQLEAERRKFGELTDTQAKADAEAYLALRRLVDTAEIYRKAREAAFQVEIGIEQILQSQLDLVDRAISAEQARVQRQAARGDITEAEAMRLNNSIRIEQMDLNRERRASKERELAAQRNRFETETVKLREQLADPKLGLTVVEQNNRIVAAQQQWTQEIIATEGAIQDLDASYAEMAENSEGYARQIKQSFINGFADAMTESITNFRKAGQVWINFAKQISDEIIGIFAKAFAQRLFRSFSFSFIDRILNTGGGRSPVSIGDAIPGPAHAAEGGLVSGPGTGTSDSIPVMVSSGEHIMPARQTAYFLPLLEGIRTGRIHPSPEFFRSSGGVVQSIAIPSIIPKHYAGGGVVTSDGGASSVKTGQVNGNMTVQLHPETMNMTMREWLEHEATRQYARR